MKSSRTLLPGDTLPQNKNVLDLTITELSEEKERLDTLFKSDIESITLRNCYRLEEINNALSEILRVKKRVKKVLI